MTRTPKTTALLAALTVSAFGLAAVPAAAQTPMTKTPTEASANASALDKSDAKLLGEIAQGNMAEVTAGQLALEKSQDASVKKFAQQMVDDHGAALKEVQALAASKNTKLPDSPDLKHKTMATGMKALKGNTFDSQYAKRAGVGDHEATVALLKKTQAEARDADLKALAGKMLPTVEHHLTMARELAATKTASK